MSQIRNFFTSNEEDMVQFVNSLPRDAYFLECDGSVCEDLQSIGPGKLVQIHFRMCGGKGGFGSLLRSFRIHKSHNQLMCRNLSGRRMADVKEEERLKKWVGKKEEREKEKVKKEKEKIEKLKNGNRTKHEFSDQTYLRRRDMVLDEVEDAIEAGMKAMEGKKQLEGSSSEEANKSSASPEVSSAEVIEQDMSTTSTATENTKEKEESSSDSDFDLDELMSAGPMKKKVKRG